MKTVASILFALFAVSASAEKKRFVRSSGGCGKPSPVSTGTTTVMSGKYGGVTRSWRVYVPSGYTGNDPTPLIVSTHGWGGDGKEDERDSGLTDTAKNGANYIAVYPDGYADNPSRGKWGSWNCVGSTQSPGPDGQTCTKRADPSNSYCYTSCNGCKGADGCDWTTCEDDITSTGVGASNVDGFIPQLYNYIEDNFCVDTTREYHTGMSNGAMFTYQAGVSMSARLAAIVPVAGAFHRGFQQAPTSKVPLLDIHGTKDTTVPGNKSVSADGWYYTEISENTKAFAQANGCSGTSLSAYTPKGVTSSVANQFKLTCVSHGCDVASCAWNGGHLYFGDSGVWGGGVTNGNLVWGFLSQYQKTSHVGHGFSEGEEQGEYVNKIFNVTAAQDEGFTYNKTALEVGAGGLRGKGYTFGKTGHHYGNPFEQECLDDEELVRLNNGKESGKICAPRKTVSSGLKNESFDTSNDCVLGGVNPFENGCPKDLPNPSGGTYAAWPTCLSKVSKQRSQASCLLVCDPCRAGAAGEECSPDAHNMCPDGSKCMTGFLRNVRQGICVYTKPKKKYHLTSDTHCFETTYFDSNYKSKGFVAGPCDASFNKLIRRSNTQVCYKNSATNLKDCPAPRDVVVVTIDTKGKE